LSRRLWATVEYDGTDFAGFQVQADELPRTVQGELERALEAVTGRETRVVGAGRTDRGVHAQGQVISFEVEWQHDLPDLHRALNAVLAQDLVVLQMGIAPAEFHPRFSAAKRTYQYRVLNRPWRSPLERRTAWHVARKLEMAPLADSSGCLVGTHDFATFGRSPEGENTVRTVFRAEWQNQDGVFIFDITANAFLYRMVRSIVGMLMLVGLGQMAPEDFEALLPAQDRSLVKQVAPAHGLCLMRVDYAMGEGVLQ